MRLIFILLILLEGITMASELFEIDINGTKVPVIYEYQENLPLINAQMIFKNSGFLADSIDGIASLSANLLDEGTLSKGAVEFATELDNHAIHLNANVGRETFVINLESLKSELDFATDKLVEMLKDPNYTKEAFTKIQTEALGQIMQKQSDFDYIAAIGLRKIIFKNRPLDHGSLGDKESVSKITLNDTKEYINSHLLLGNLIIVIGGGISKEEAKKVAQKIASPLQSGSSTPIKHFEALDVKEQKVIYKDTDQAYIYFGGPFNMEVNSTSRHLAKLAGFILGSGGFGSRIMEEIRVKRGLAYSAYSRFVISKTNSYFSGYLQTKLNSQDEAQTVVTKLIEEFIQDGVTKDELESAKKFYLGSQRLRVETLNQRLQQAFHEYYEGVGLGYSKKELEKIKNVTLDEINEFIKSHPEILNLSWSIVTKKSK